MIDIGVNINHKAYLENIEETLKECQHNGVEGLICIASDLTESKQIQALCEDHQQLWFTLGCHPHQASTWNNNSSTDLAQLIELKHPIAIGETGLDFNRNYSTRNEQIYAFESQIELALAYDLPLYLHERDAHQDMLSILKKHFSSNIRGVIHCFTGSKAELYAYLELELYIGITGWVCDERRGHSLQEAVPFIPDDKLLLETDAPYLLPRNIRPRPKRNHPKFLPWIAQEVARLREVPIESLIIQTKKNTQRLFFPSKM